MKGSKERYDQQKRVILPKAHYDWLPLRLQDYESVNEYNSATFTILCQLKLCGECLTDKDVLERRIPLSILLYAFLVIIS